MTTVVAVHITAEAREELRAHIQSAPDCNWIAGDSLVDAEALVRAGDVPLLLVAGPLERVEYACLARLLSSDRTLRVLVSTPESARAGVSGLVGASVREHVCARIFALQALPEELSRCRTQSTAVSAAEFEGVMSSLRERYADALHEKVTVVQVLLQQCAGDEQVDAARMRVHKLRGSAALFGHKALGAAAGLLEDALLEFKGTGAGWNHVVSALEHLRATAASVGEGRASDASHSQAFRAGCVVFLDDDAALFERLRGVGGRLFVDVIRITRPEEALVYAADRKVFGAVVGVRSMAEVEETARALRASVGDERLTIALACDDQSVQVSSILTSSRHMVFFNKHATNDDLSQVLRACSREEAGPRYRVMVVDDDQDFSSYVEALLHTMDVDVALRPSADGMLQFMDEWAPDLLLIDIVLPGTSGVELCRVLRRYVRWHHTPIMLVTGRVSDELRLEAYRAGASDFISKPLIPEELVARISVRLEHNRLLREYAEQDSLSGLWLRRPLLDAAHRMFAHAQRNRETVAVALLDLDCFKSINDTRGHSAGDEVIAGLGRLIRARLRISDLKCRWGGEEFLLVFDGTHARSAVTVVESLLETFSAIDFGTGTGELFRATFSAGVADTTDIECRFESVLESADQALYRAKQSGRSRVVRADNSWKKGAS